MNARAMASGGQNAAIPGINGRTGNPAQKIFDLWCATAANQSEAVTVIVPHLSERHVFEWSDVNLALAADSFYVVHSFNS